MSTYVKKEELILNVHFANISNKSYSAEVTKKLHEWPCNVFIPFNSTFLFLQIRIKTHKQCFVAKEFVQWLCVRYEAESKQKV